jgi:hypothetical protein
MACILKSVGNWICGSCGALEMFNAVKAIGVPDRLDLEFDVVWRKVWGEGS